MQDYQFYIQNFTALQLGTEVPSGRQATFEYSFIPAEPMGGRPFGLVINLNYKDATVSLLRTRLLTAPGDLTEGSLTTVYFCPYPPPLAYRETSSRTPSSTRR